MTKIIKNELNQKYFEKDRDDKLMARLAKFKLAKGNTFRFYEINDTGKRTGRYYDKKVLDCHQSRETIKHWTWSELVKYGIYLIRLGRAQKIGSKNLDRA
ncbi:MAG: hypothetical protein ABH807_01960 [Candidatus Shapirobacteria bacterium]